MDANLKLINKKGGIKVIMNIDATMGWYVVLLIIGFLLFLLIRHILEDRNLKIELQSLKNELKFVRILSNAYEKQYGPDLAKEVIDDMIKSSGITDENPLRIKSQVVLFNKFKFGLKDKENNTLKDKGSK